MRIRVLLMTLLMCCGVPFLAAAAQEDAPEQAMLGDLNRDGSCDIRDVQAMICQALQVREQVREADLDENGAVNIFDVQSGINTALETAGLVRRVRGRVEGEDTLLQSRVQVRAVSHDGQYAQGDVDPATGEFVLRLRVNSAWSVAFFADHNGQGQQQTGTLEIPVGEKASCLVPLAGLSHGGELDLGNLQFQERMRATRDMRTMFAHMNRWMFQNDSDGDGIPDFCAPLLTRAQEGPGVPQAMRQGEGLAVYVAPCVTEWLEQITEVSLTDADEDGIPDFVAPLIDCIESSLDEWFAGHGQPMPGNGDQGANFVANLIAYVVDGIPEWLANLDSPDVIDADGDGIPDYLEPLLREPGGPNAVDTDGDGRPDFAQDADGDGIPNCLDDDFRCPNDCDGDAIPNADDRDQDNDGVPNYADAEPCNPDVH
ncbi:MAG TPA: hypothetical protein PLB67_09010 [Candidatus Hydrogenedentes bacterium]|nr:hypothetical protein [Candidatus Hydrogenedentota bacterium]HPV36190.1 hypothetical protein [Candidatus Hydrogenedentota bacterium]